MLKYDMLYLLYNLYKYVVANLVGELGLVSM